MLPGGNLIRKWITWSAEKFFNNHDAKPERPEKDNTGKIFINCALILSAFIVRYKSKTVAAFLQPLSASNQIN